MSTSAPTTSIPARPAAPKAQRLPRLPLAIKLNRLTLASIIVMTFFNLLAALAFVGGINWGSTTAFNGAPGFNWETFWPVVLPVTLSVLGIAIVVVVLYVHHRLAITNRNGWATALFGVGLVVAAILGGLALWQMVAGGTVALALIALAIFAAFTVLEVLALLGTAYLLRTK